jgi:hypothetical protein
MEVRRLGGDLASVKEQCEHYRQFIVETNTLSDYYDCLYCDLASEGAQLGLFALMAGISEECWCAGWMSGNEFALWKVKPDTQYGQGVITERQARLLELLSEECDGWWMWEDGPKFVSREKFAAHIKTGPNR